MADFRMYDTRVGRWWGVDKIVKVHESPYAAFFNNPINFADPSGLNGVPVDHTPRDKGGAEGTGGGAESMDWRSLDQSKAKDKNKATPTQTPSTQSKTSEQKTPAVGFISPNSSLVPMTMPPSNPPTGGEQFLNNPLAKPVAALLSGSARALTGWAVAIVAFFDAQEVGTTHLGNITIYDDFTFAGPDGKKRDYRPISSHLRPPTGDENEHKEKYNRLYVDNPVALDARIQDPSSMGNQIISGELWGLPYKRGVGDPVVKAHRGPLPEGKAGFEFITYVPESQYSWQPRYAYWYKGSPGVETFIHSDGRVPSTLSS